MKVSVITVCRNAGAEIDATLRSVVMQDHADIEHIVIDGASTDDTVARVKRYAECIAHLVSEPDEGVYDAMNKGLRLATGDIVAFVNAGDMLARRDVATQMVQAFERTGADAVYGDALMVDPIDITRVRRFWKGGAYRRKAFRWGWMPPHLGTWIARRVYERLGPFNTTLRVAADYELLLRFMYVHRIKVHYAPIVVVRFRLGGVSNRSLAHIWRANREVYKAWAMNGVRVSPFIALWKPLRKVAQYLVRS